MGYSGSTTGLTSMNFVVPQTAIYTAQATVEDFVNNAGNGEIGFFDSSTHALYAGAIPVGASYQIYQKRDGNVFWTGPVIHKVGDASACDLVAAVNQASEVTITAGATAPGETFTLALFDRTEANQPFPVEAYEFVSITGVETAVDIANGIVANYNQAQANFDNKAMGNDPAFVITNVGAVITIVTKDVRTNFETIVRDDLINGLNATVVADGTGTSVLWVGGEGTGREVVQLESEGFEFEGHRYRNTPPIDNWGGKATVFGKELCTYDKVKILTVGDSESHGEPIEVRHQRRNMVLAVESAAVGVTGSPAYATIKTVLGI